MKPILSNASTFYMTISFDIFLEYYGYWSDLNYPHSDNNSHQWAGRMVRDSNTNPELFSHWVKRRNTTEREYLKAKIKFIPLLQILCRSTTDTSGLCIFLRKNMDNCIKPRKVSVQSEEICVIVVHFRKNHPMKLYRYNILAVQLYWVQLYNYKCSSIIVLCKFFISTLY
jgi:hypothetical protein